MLRIRLLCDLVTMPSGVPVPHSAGDVLDWAKVDAERMVANGVAVLVAKDTPLLRK